MIPFVTTKERKTARENDSSFFLSNEKEIRKKTIREGDANNFCNQIILRVTFKLDSKKTTNRNNGTTLKVKLCKVGEISRFPNIEFKVFHLQAMTSCELHKFIKLDTQRHKRLWKICGNWI